MSSMWFYAYSIRREEKGPHSEPCAEPAMRIYKAPDLDPERQLQLTKETQM